MHNVYMFALLYNPSCLCVCAGCSVLMGVSVCVGCCVLICVCVCVCVCVLRVAVYSLGIAWYWGVDDRRPQNQVLITSMFVCVCVCARVCMCVFVSLLDFRKR